MGVVFEGATGLVYVATGVMLSLAIYLVYVLRQGWRYYKQRTCSQA